MLYFRSHRQGFKNAQEIAGQDLTVLLESGRRRLEEREFVEKMTSQVQEQHQYIGTMQEALSFHLEEVGTLQQIKNDLEQNNRNLEQNNRNLVEHLWQRDQEIARLEYLQRETWLSRESYRRQYEIVINSKRFRLFEALSELLHGRQIGWQIRELLRILLPSAWRERGRRWRLQIKSPGSAGRRLGIKFKEKINFYAVRLFDSHRYQQQNYGDNPLLTLVVDCDASGNPLTVLYASLKEQTWSNFSIIFLVSAGDHELAQKLNTEITRDKRSDWKVLITELNSSVGLFNQALATAEGKYIVSLRSADVLIPTFLEECLLLLEASPPHFFIQSENRSEIPVSVSPELVSPAASLHENRFRALIFPRLAGLEVKGYDETLSAGYAAWELYLKLLRSGYVGSLLAVRISRGLVCEAEPAASNFVDAISEKERIVDLHRAYFVKSERRILRRARQYWRVTQPLLNLLPESNTVRKNALWLDLRASHLPEHLFLRLMARPEDPDIPLIITINKRWQSFFRYNKKAGMQVYLPESYHLQGREDYCCNYLQAAYQLRQISINDILQTPISDLNSHSDKLSILYVAPWLITGGADTMTVDWFNQLKPSWNDKYFATTIYRDHNWLPKIAESARGIYNLPELGCRDQASMTAFLLEFIDLYKIDILHIMNSEMAFNALPELKGKFPDLKVVAQFHCFDYSPEGQPVGYAFTVPPRYDHLIDRYNLEYSRLGEEIAGFYPYIESSKFKVIHGCVDGSLYDPENRQPRMEIAACRQAAGLNILFIGRLDRQKQPLRLLEIAVGLRSRGISFVMHIIGDGSLDSRKKEFIAELQQQGLADQVKFYGEQPQELLVDWYLIADILLLTSDWEGIPMVLYQAMAMAVVPVVSDVGGCAELITPACGYLVTERENPAAYLAAIAELTDDKRRHKMASAARQRMLEHFSLAELDHEYQILYEDLVK